MPRRVSQPLGLKRIKLIVSRPFDRHLPEAI